MIYWDRGKYLVLIAKSIQGYILEEYGKTWLAYAQQPAHIAREKWDGCEWCCDEILFDSEAMSLELLHPLRDDNPQTVNPNYCPMCGRPLTEEAWAELERRVFGG